MIPLRALLICRGYADRIVQARALIAAGLVAVDGRIVGDPRMDVAGTEAVCVGLLPAVVLRVMEYDDGAVPGQTEIER